MEEFVFFHDFAMVILRMILTLVGYVLGMALLNKRINLGLLEGQTLEAV